MSETHPDFAPAQCGTPPWQDLAATMSSSSAEYSTTIQSALNGSHSETIPSDDQQLETDDDHTETLSCEDRQPPIDDLHTEPLPYEDAQPSASFTSQFTENHDSSEASDDEEPYTLPPIRFWTELKCIRVLNRFYNNNGVDFEDPGHEILYRMCQIAWAVGNEVAVRKQIKLPRAQRLAKFQHYFNCLLQGAKMWQRSLKAQVRAACEVVHASADPSPMDCFQDLGQKMDKLKRAIRTLHRPSPAKVELFTSVFDHYQQNCVVLYRLHREKPDYGLRDIFPTVDKVYKVLKKLPGYATEADKLFWQCHRRLNACFERYLEDRERQEAEIQVFNSESVEWKRRYFVQYVYTYYPHFKEGINRPGKSPMSQDEFNWVLEKIRAEFFEYVAEIIKRDIFWEYIDGVKEVQFERLLESEQRRLQALEAKQGWMEALRLSPSTVFDDDVADKLTINGYDDDELRTLANVRSRSTGKSLSRQLDEASFESDSEPEDNEDHEDSDFPKVVPLQEPKQAQHDEITEPQTPPNPCTFDHDAMPMPSSPTRAVKEPEHEILQSRLSYQQSMLRDESPPSFAESMRRYQSQSGSQNPAKTCLPRFTFNPSTTEGHEDTLTELRPPMQRHLQQTLPLHLSKSFAAVEDDLASRKHQRSSTVADADYVAAIDTPESDSPKPAASFHGRATATRRHGVQVPRIFTGSFSQLESDIRSLKLDKVKTPEDQPDLSHEGELRIRDFAVTPRDSPSPTPSPATLLFRREALLSKETKMQARIINGEVVRSRRPSTKTRAQTLEAGEEGLDTWLGRSTRRDGAPMLPRTPLPRPERKHTI